MKYEKLVLNSAVHNTEGLIVSQPQYFEWRTNEGNSQIYK